MDFARELHANNDDNYEDSDSIKIKRFAPLAIIAPEGLSTVGENEWESFELAVDSGASETVVNENMIVTTDVQEGLNSKNGVEYEVANGIRIPNLGAKRLIGVTSEGVSRRWLLKSVTSIRDYSV